jgi:hypothetical protein
MAGPVGYFYVALNYQIDFSKDQLQPLWFENILDSNICYYFKIWPQTLAKSDLQGETPS